jgi:hypothetical protein
VTAREYVTRRGGIVLLLSSPFVFGCASGPAHEREAVVARSVAASFPDDFRALARYRSKRLALSLPLPDGKAWRIDDHSRPELVAAHPPTRSRVVVSVFRADELVGRTQCESLARTRRLIPPGQWQTLEDEVTITQQTFDTRIWVALEAGGGPDRPLVGRVMAFGGFLRKCYVFDFSTEVDGAADEPVLSSRMAFARARILGGLELDAFEAAPRNDPAGARMTPSR